MFPKKLGPITAKFFSTKVREICGKDFAKVANDLIDKSSRDNIKALEEEKMLISSYKLKIAGKNEDLSALYSIRPIYKKYLKDRIKETKLDRLKAGAVLPKKSINIKNKQDVNSDNFSHSKRCRGYALGGVVESFVCEYFSDNYSEHFDENIINWEITGTKVPKNYKTVYIYWVPLDPGIDVEILNNKLQQVSTNISRKFSMSPEGNKKRPRIIFCPGHPPNSGDLSPVSPSNNSSTIS